MSDMVCCPTRCIMRVCMYWERKVGDNSAGKDCRGTEVQRSDDGDQGQCQHNAPAIRMQVLHQAAHQARVVRFAECFFFVHVAHARSSSSSSNCFSYKSA